jgi:hypothetical protein
VSIQPEAFRENCTGNEKIEKNISETENPF